MDIYTRRSGWNLVLLVAAVLIVVFSVMYTQRIATTIQQQEVDRVKEIAHAYETLNTSSDPVELESSLAVITNNNDIPVIWANADKSINAWKNFDSTLVKRNPNFLKKQIQILKKDNQVVVIEAEGIEPQFLYYKASRLLQNIKKYPYYQLVLVALFVLVLLITYNISRNSEQNRVWVGMAKETAHQLGTPLSSISAWMDIMRDKLTDAEGEEMINEIQKDVDRLELIADRFSKIGSPPKFKPVNIPELVSASVDYMAKRASRNVTMTTRDKTDGNATVQASAHLLEWALENLLKNALDALDGKGSIEAIISESHGRVNIDVKDTGKGIPRNKLKTVFEPGYSTKKRGWGLGLTLSKRIIEQYHQGEIFVKESEPGKGTTFRIQLIRNPHS